jgi:monoamine oxidase
VGATGAIRKLVEIAYTVEFGLDASEQSALNLVTLIGTETDKHQLFGGSDGRFHSALGSDAFTTRLTAQLDPDQVVLEHRLTRIEKQADGRYRLALDHPDGRRAVLAERVLLTLPFTLLREVEVAGFDWPLAKRRAIFELGYGTSSKLMVGFASRAWRDRGATGGSYSDSGYQASWETTRLQPGAAGILTNFTGGQHGLDLAAGSPEKQRDAFLKQLEPVFPGSAAASNGAVARFAWSNQELTRGSYSAYRVGQWTAFAGAEGERVGNLYFAGEHTSRDAQGYMEGAARTGATAALEIATDLGLPTAARLSLPAQRICERATRALRHGG